MKARFLALIAVIGSAFSTTAQDIHFSNMDYSPLTVNPALAGATQDAQAIAQYRSQWNSIGVPFQTMAVSGDARLNKKANKNGFLAVGVNFFNDRIGQPRITTNTGALTLAYHLRLDRNSYIGLGMNAGFGQRSINDSDGQWGNQYDGMSWNGDISSGEIFNNASFSLFTTGAGIVYSYNEDYQQQVRLNESFAFRTGVAAYHLNRPSYSFFNASDDLLEMRFSGFAQASFVFAGTMMGFEPSVYYQQQGPSREIFVGGDYRFFFQEASKFTGFIKRNSMSTGVYYRVGDAVVTRLMLQMANYSVGFSYDFTASRLTEVTRLRGGAEIVLRWNL